MTYIDIHRHRTLRISWHTGTEDTDALEGFEKRNAREGAVVRIQTQLPQGLRQVLPEGHALRSREYLVRPDALMPICRASRRDRQNRALEKQREL